MLYGFGIVAQEGSRLAAETEMKDTANRVSNAVLETFLLGSALQASYGSVDSGNFTPLNYTKQLSISPQSRGYDYTIAVTAAGVWINSTDGTIRTDSTTFKADVVVAPAGTCTQAYQICEISGTVAPRSTKVTITYEHKPAYIAPATAQLVNRITVS